MKKESLNEFYEADRFHKALRDRIDKHEPELSDSLWDRIEHDLNKREGKNRRALAWVYVLSGLLMLSAGAMYYLWNENQKLAENTVAIADKVERNESVATPQALVEENNASPAQVEGAELADLPLASEGGQNTSTPRTVNTAATPSASASQNTANQTGSVQNNQANASETGLNTPADIDPGLANIDGRNAVDGEKPSMIGVELKSPEEPAGGVEANGNSTGDNAKGEDKSQDPNPNTEPKAKADPNVRPQFSFGLQGGMNQISQKALSGNQEWLGLIEKPMSFGEYGMSIGVRFNSGLYLSSGVNSYSTGHAYTFDIVPTSPTPIPTPFPGADSIIAGNRYTLINRQNWVEVPVLVGYQYSIGKWSLNGEAGLSANFINSYSGSVPTPAYNRFEPDGTQNANPYKNFLNMRAGLGFGYELFSGLQLSAMANWKQALTYSTNAPSSAPWQASYAHRKPQSLGAQIRLTYYLK